MLVDGVVLCLAKVLPTAFSRRQQSLFPAPPRGGTVISACSSGQHLTPMPLSNVWPLVFSERSLVVKLEPVHRVQFLLYAASPLSSVSFKHHHHTVIHSRKPELGLTLGACQYEVIKKHKSLSIDCQVTAMCSSSLPHPSTSTLPAWSDFGSLIIL